MLQIQAIGLKYSQEILLGKRSGESYIQRSKQV